MNLGKTMRRAIGSTNFFDRQAAQTGRDPRPGKARSQEAVDHE
jgi:hypothetical protein